MELERENKLRWCYKCKKHHLFMPRGFEGPDGNRRWECLHCGEEDYYE